MPIQATPRNKLLGLLADGIQGVNDFARKPFGYDNPPAGLLMDALSVPAVAATVDRLSYGEPLTTGKGFTRKMRPDTVETALALAPAAVKYPKQTAGIVGGLLGVADTGAVNKAATVWHGTPHKFDKFDASKIGTGEGAQAYGHGLYFAESPEVAGAYKNLHGGSPSQKSFIRMRDKAPLGSAEWAHYEELAREAGGSLYKVDLPDDQIAKMLDWDKPLSKQPAFGAMKDVAKQRAKAEALRTAEDIARSKLASNLPPKDFGDDWLTELFSPTSIQEKEIFDNLVNQEMSVIDLDSLSKKHFEAMKRPDQTWDISGKDFYKSLVDQSSPAKASELLQSQGIPGVRYWDGGSRQISAGTSNFVVFPGNEGLLTILERNGQPIK